LATHGPSGCAFRPGFLGAAGGLLLLLPSGAVLRARHPAGGGVLHWLPRRQPIQR